LSTCNRVEIICTGENIEAVVWGIKKFLSDFHQIPIEKIASYLYFYQNQEAISHIFRVASGLDSMVIGEPQILGQLKEAYRIAANYKRTGVVLNRLFHKAFSVAKRVRTETGVSHRAVSIGFAAAELARKIFDNLAERKILLVGAGKMAELVTRHLLNYGVKELFITNRTLEKAISLANEFSGKVLPFERILDDMVLTDIVISSTAAQHFIISYSEVVNLLHKRKNKPMFFIDIAVPRNIDPQINNLPNVYLYNIDDLDGVVMANRRAREKEAMRAEKIIDDEQKQFYFWFQQQAVTPTIIQLREKVEKIRIHEIEKTFRRWEGLGAKEKEKIDILTSAIVNKFLHDPITFLKAKNELGGSSVEIIKKIFKLNDDEKNK
ncbi:MAG: glutamyl-tRNA reductase, partial [Desulfobacterota bacterium]|nr:glutamyl-tRNA reductase [Thermodesulfobacteriota bacterium]